MRVRGQCENHGERRRRFPATSCLPHLLLWGFARYGYTLLSVEDRRVDMSAMICTSDSAAFVILQFMKPFFRDEKRRAPTKKSWVPTRNEKCLCNIVEAHTVAVHPVVTVCINDSQAIILYTSRSRVIIHYRLAPPSHKATC